MKKVKLKSIKGKFPRYIFIDTLSFFNLHISVNWLYKYILQINILMFKLLFPFYLYLRHYPHLSCTVTEYFHIDHLLQLTNKYIYCVLYDLLTITSNVSFFNCNAFIKYQSFKGAWSRFGQTLFF